MPRGNRIKHDMHLALEYRPRNAIEGDLCFVACLYALPTVLPEGYPQCPIALIGVDKDHQGPKGIRDRIHPGTQGELCYETVCVGPDGSLREIKFSIG